MNAVLKFAVAFALLAILAVAAVSFSTLPGSAGAAQARLEQETLDALGVDAADWAAVTIDGQKAIVSGEAPSPQARDALIARIAAAEWSGGLVVGGVTAVDATALTVAPERLRAEPYIFIAEHEGDIVSLSGYAPDEVSREALYSLARNLFGEAEFSATLEVADGAPVSNADWSVAASNMLRALAYLRHGVAEADDSQFSLTGEAEDETRALAARTLIMSLPQGLTGETDIAIRQAPASIEDIIAQSEQPPETQTEPALETDVAASDDSLAPAPSPVEEEAVAQPADCLSDLEEELATHNIGFNSARADIDNRSRAHLRTVASVLIECPSARLRITGHTDSSGNPARNRQLSGYRADAVRAFLVSVGAPADRLTASGVGSAQPVASNATSAGRARNRRIDIEVYTAE